jgi:hypothetical protein
MTQKTSPRMNCFLIGICVLFGTLAQAQMLPMPVQEISLVQVPVLTVKEFNRTLPNPELKCLPSADPSAPEVEGAISASQACAYTNTSESVRVFKVVYEHLGRQYAVELPENPGPYLQLQATAMPEQNFLTYPSVYYSGFMYRPMPVFMGFSYRGGVGHRLGRGRRH